MLIFLLIALKSVFKTLVVVTQSKLKQHYIINEIINAFMYKGVVKLIIHWNKIILK